MKLKTLSLYFNMTTSFRNNLITSFFTQISIRNTKTPPDFSNFSSGVLVLQIEIWVLSFKFKKVDSKTFYWNLFEYLNIWYTNDIEKLTAEAVIRTDNVGSSATIFEVRTKIWTKTNKLRKFISTFRSTCDHSQEKNYLKTK